MRPARALIFDFDLTLVDSTAGVAECANHALEVLGFPLVDAQRVREAIGLTLEQSFRFLSGSSDEQLAAAYHRHFVSRADRVMEDLVHVIPGAAAALDHARQQGCRTGIVSSRYRYRIEAILGRSRLLDRFDAIVGAEDVLNHKPHAEAIQRILGMLDVAPANAVYVGDHTVDAQAATAAEVAFIAVLTGVTTREAWAPYTPLAVIPSVADLPDLLANRTLTLPV